MEHRYNRNRSMFSNNKSGVTGVRFCEKRGVWLAEWREIESGKLKRKSFSSKTYGNDAAFKMACDYRARMISAMNDRGAGYGSSHGLKDAFELEVNSNSMIEKNIPPPVAVNHPFKDMEVGDSVLVDEKARIYAHRYGHSSGKKFTTRKEGGAFRVWRVS